MQPTEHNVVCSEATAASRRGGPEVEWPEMEMVWNKCGV